MAGKVIAIVDNAEAYVDRVCSLHPSVSPELNKNTIQAQLKLSADEANAEAVKLADYVHAVHCLDAKSTKMFQRLPRCMGNVRCT